jgi:hypothetical protein
MLEPAGDRLGGVHRLQVHREPWPDFAAFDPRAWPTAQRRDAAIQWAGRARNEHGSVQQFAQLSQVLATARVELELLGCLARMITDEIRHAELCAAMAQTIWPEGLRSEAEVFRWPQPRAPWPDPPLSAAAASEDDDPEPLLAWACAAILTACCLGETLSKPMLEALVVVSTEPLAEAVSRQILRDEHLHATFGFESLALLLPRLSAASRAGLQTRLARNLAGFERSVCASISIADVANSELVIERGEPNLGILSDHQYAVIFYACLESELFPKLRALGLDPDTAWATR